MEDRFLRGRQTAYMIYVSLHVDDIQDFDTGWDQALSSTSEVPKDSFLDSLYNMRTRGSDQLQTVLAMYEQEINQDRSRPSCQKFEDHGGET